MAKILVVDDEEDIRLSLTSFLNKEQHTVKAAENGKEALRLLQKEKFELVLLDILMPGMTGIEVAKSIKEKDKNQKIIFLSVVTLGEEGTKKIRDLDPEYYINKPFALNDLRGMIKKALSS